MTCRTAINPNAGAQLAAMMTALDPNAELVKLLERARDITSALPQSACVVAAHHHVWSALAIAEHLKAGRS